MAKKKLLELASNFYFPSPLGGSGNNSQPPNIKKAEIASIQLHGSYKHFLLIRFFDPINSGVWGNKSQPPKSIKHEPCKRLHATNCNVDSCTNIVTVYTVFYSLYSRVAPPFLSGHFMN